MRSQERRHSTLSHRACQSTGTKSDVVCVILMMKMVATMMMMAQWMDAQRQTVYRSSAAQRSSGNSTGNTSCIVCQFVRSLRQSRQIQSSMQLQPGGKPQEGNTCKISQYMQAVRSSQTDTSSLASSAAAETAPRIIARPTSSTRSTCQGRTPLLEATLSRHLRRVRRAGGSLPRRGRADDLQERGAHHHEQEEAEQQRPNRDLVLVPLRRVSTQV